VLPSNYDTQDCSVARALETLGERWTLLIVRDALHGVTRYDDFLARLGVPTSTLARRLDQLADAGIFTRHRYETRPPRYEYRLTGPGRELATVIAALREWGDRHLSPGGPPADYKHRGCGGTAITEMKCDACGQQLQAQDIARTEYRPVRKTRRRAAHEPGRPPQL
jgi:DNA-binding HxlR family transcriptional regulator